jgi:hypothetical protein
MKSKIKTPRSGRHFTLLIGALLGSIGLASCGQFSADFEAYATDDTDKVGGDEGAGEGTGGTTSTGGGSTDNDIIVEPEVNAAPSSIPLADLCGAGECVVGGGECGATETCQLIPVEGTAIGACGPAGKSDDGFACKTAQDCLSGMGCAASPNGGGVCKNYCCGNPEDCPTKTYCASQPMAEDPTSIAIPVCVPANVCPLLTDGACDPGLTCAIVRDDGTTSCVPPGPGQLNEACPCAAGFVCSKLFNQCKKLCHIGKDAEDCGGNATCQAGSSGFPEGFGACFGGDN